MMERAFDIRQRKHPLNVSYVSRHVFPMSRNSTPPPEPRKALCHKANCQSEFRAGGFCWANCGQLNHGRESRESSADQGRHAIVELNLVFHVRLSIVCSRAPSDSSWPPWDASREEEESVSSGQCQTLARRTNVVLVIIPIAIICSVRGTRWRSTNSWRSQSVLTGKANMIIRESAFMRLGDGTGVDSSFRRSAEARLNRAPQRLDPHADR